MMIRSGTAAKHFKPLSSDVQVLMACFREIHSDYLGA
jgi:hypothetical protein